MTTGRLTTPCTTHPVCLGARGQAPGLDPAGGDYVFRRIISTAPPITTVFTPRDPRGTPDQQHGCHQEGKGSRGEGVRSHFPTALHQASSDEGSEAAEQCWKVRPDPFLPCTRLPVRGKGSEAGEGVRSHFPTALEARAGEGVRSHFPTALHQASSDARGKGSGLTFQQLCTRLPAMKAQKLPNSVPSVISTITGGRGQVSLSNSFARGKGSGLTFQQLCEHTGEVARGRGQVSLSNSFAPGFQR
jgi:hypothetical protein